MILHIYFLLSTTNKSTDCMMLKLKQQTFNAAQSKEMLRTQGLESQHEVSPKYIFFYEKDNKKFNLYFGFWTKNLPYHTFTHCLA